MHAGRRRAFSAVLVVVASLSARGARADDAADPWFGKDKALHFAVSGTLAAGGYAAGAALFDARGHALLFGGALALTAGVAKEAADVAGLGDPSWKDLAWDGIGTAAGLAVAWGIDLLFRGVSAKTPALAQPLALRGYAF